MTLSVDFDALPPAIRYKLLTAVVIPRPVAWITTLNPDGSANAAPYSFFNVFGQDPALVVLGLQHKADGSAKDTPANIGSSGEFVINIANVALTEAMVATATAYAPGVSEPEALELALAPSSKIATPRLAEAPVALECRRVVSLTFSQERELLVGEVIGLTAMDGLIDTDTWYVDWQGNWPIARLFGERYARLEEIGAFPIPPAPQSQQEV
ncbi:MAG: flavin reductase family protein [Pseudomonadota bacterium]